MAAHSVSCSHWKMFLIASVGSPRLQPRSKMDLGISNLALPILYLSWSSGSRIHPDKHHLEELQPQGIAATGIPGPRHHWSSCQGKLRQSAILKMALIGISGLALWICTKLVYLSAHMAGVTGSWCRGSKSLLGSSGATGSWCRVCRGPGSLLGGLPSSLLETSTTVSSSSLSCTGSMGAASLKFMAALNDG